MSTPIPAPFDEYITTAQASAATGLSQPQLTQLCRQERLECYKLTPRTWLIKKASLDAYEARIRQLESEGKRRGRRSGKRAHKKAPQ